MAAGELAETAVESDVLASDREAKSVAGGRRSDLTASLCTRTCICRAEAVVTGEAAETS